MRFQLGQITNRGKIVRRITSESSDSTFVRYKIFDVQERLFAEHLLEPLPAPDADEDEVISFVSALDGEFYWHPMWAGWWRVRTNGSQFLSHRLNHQDKVFRGLRTAIDWCTEGP